MRTEVQDNRDLRPNEWRASVTGMEGRPVTIIAREGKFIFLLFDRAVIRAAFDCVTGAGTMRFSVSTGRWTEGPPPEVPAPPDLAPIVGQTFRSLKFYHDRMQIEFDRHRIVLTMTGAFCFPKVFSEVQ